MCFKRYLFFTLILFLIIFSVSFVSANEDLTHGNNTNDITALSIISDDNIIDENINDVKLSSVKESSSSTLDLADEAQQSETEKDDCLTNEPQILRASNDEPVLGADQYLNGGTGRDVMNAIVQCSNSGGGTIYLNGGTYDCQGWDWPEGARKGTLTAGQNQIITIKNVRVVGGSPGNPNQMATFLAAEGSTVMDFGGYTEGIPGQYTSWGSQRQGNFKNSGVNLENVVFENLITTSRFFSFNSGSLTNCVFNNLESLEHLFFLTGSYWDNAPVPVTNCNFTNCHQTYPGKNPEAGTDGSGQFGAVFGAKFVGCNFINTSSATHGGAFCLSDESEWGAGRVASSIIDCNFINITSRWFAVYIHGNFSTSFAYIDQPQVIDNCNFINCTGTGEYGGAVGISHNGVEIKNSNFINNTGGQGAAIMVGGIDRNHDGFNGRNTQGNNILIENCKFEGNVAKVDGQSSSVSPDHGNFEGHPTGNAGAIYIYGNNTRILDSTFDSNIAGSGEGAAVYIQGERTVIDNSKFYNHESDRGTVYIEGGNSQIIDSTFKDNSAENGAGVYIEGKNTLISGTDFDSNVATESGAGVYIQGDNTRIISDSSFENNLAVDGAGVYVVGKGTEISDSTFEYNNATNGGAVYINGQSSTISSNTFDHNNVTNQGGAVYVEGSGTSFSSNVFTNNEAVPESAEGTDGLGGAIYVKGDNTNTDSNEFTHNKARNGSAIYTDGNNFNLAHDIFNENQAWSYLLIVTPKPEESYYNESDVNITVCHVGGDNIINAIHNTAGPSQVHFTDVTSNNNGRNIYTGTSTVSPVEGAENSNNGQLVYQDDREYLQKVIITKIICDEDGVDILNGAYINLTNITGEIRLTIKKPIKVGNYTVYAEHPEDWNYKYIANESTFRVLPLVDLDTNKTSDKEVYYVGDLVVWTIKVHSAGNGTNATNVTLRDVLPSGFSFINATATKGNYSNENKTWTIGNMANGTTETLTINSRAVNNGTYTNEVNVTSNEKDWNVSNDYNNKTVIVRPVVNLTINKTVVPDHVRVNETVTFTVNVTNNGPSNATNVNITDVVPEQFGNVVFNGSVVANNVISFIIDKLNVNASYVFSFTAVARVNGTWNNTASTYCKENKTVKIDNATVIVDPIADLEVNKTVSVPTARFGDVVTWTITVKNNGPNTAVDAWVDDVLPSELVDVTVVSVDQGDFAGNVWTIGNLTSGESVVLVIKTTVDATNVNVTNVVLVNSSTYDPNETNNTDNDTVVVPPEADLSVVKEADVDEAHIGDVVTWTITVTNNGPDVAVDAYVDDVIPKELTGVSVVSVDKGSFDGETWTIGNLTSGESVVLVIKTTVDATNVNVTNVVLVNSSTYDPNKTNNKNNDTVEVPPEADLVVTITNNFEESGEICHKGDEIVWTITVTNNGPDTAVNSVLKDVLPDGVIYLSHDNANGTYDNESAVWSIGDLPNGETVTLTIVTKANTTNATVYRNVSASTDTYEPDLTNNYDNSSVVIPPEADLVIVKEVSDASAHKGDTVTWTITVTNNGPDTAVNVVVNDVIKDGLVVVGVSGGELADGVWTVGDLASGASATLTVETQIDATNETLINNVNTTSDTYDPNETNNNGTNNTVVPPEADLVVTITNNFEESGEICHKGDEIVWTITVTNNGPDTAVNSVLKDVLPDGVIYVSHDNANGTYDNESAVWSIGDLPNGETVTLTIVTKANTTNATVYRNVSASTDTYEPDLTNNYDNSSVVIPPEADLEVTITNNFEDSDVPCHVGDTVEWTITVTNHGPDDAINTVLSDSLPDGVVYVSDDSDGAYDPETGIWTIGDLPVGESVTLTIKTIANTSNDTIVRDVNVSSETYDPDLTNNYDNSSVEIPPEADLEVTITNDHEDVPCHNGDNVTWTITIVNHGPNDAINTKLSEILPEGVVYVSDDSNGKYDSETGTWTVGDLPVGESVTLTVVTAVNTSNVTIVNPVNVSSDTYDPNLTNNKDDSSIVVIPEADLEIIKLVSNDAPHKNDKITWTIIVTNNGRDTAVNAVVTDKLPSGLVYVSDDSNGGYDAETGVWTIGDISSGKSVTLNIVTLVGVTNQTMINVANVTSDTYDPNETNNECNNTTDVPPEADLVITIEPNVDKVKIGDKVEFTVTVVNQGPDTAVNSRAFITLPDGLKLLDFKPSKGTYNPKTRVWTIGDLAPGEEVTLVLNTEALVSGKFVVEAYTVCDTYESNLTNNNDTTEIEVTEPETPETPETPEEPPVNVPVNGQTMHATGNPIIMVLMALLAMVGISLRRKG